MLRLLPLLMLASLWACSSDEEDTKEESKDEKPVSKSVYYENDFDDKTPLSGWLFYNARDKERTPSASVPTPWTASLASKSDKAKKTNDKRSPLSDPGALNFQLNGVSDPVRASGMAITPLLDLNVATQPVATFWCKYETPKGLPAEAQGAKAGKSPYRRRVLILERNEKNVLKTVLEAPMSVNPKDAGPRHAGPCAGPDEWHRHQIRLNRKWGVVHLAFDVDGGDKKISDRFGWYVDNLRIVEREKSVSEEAEYKSITGKPLKKSSIAKGAGSNEESEAASDNERSSGAVAKTDGNATGSDRKRRKRDQYTESYGSAYYNNSGTTPAYDYSQYYNAGDPAAAGATDPTSGQGTGALSGSNPYRPYGNDGWGNGYPGAGYPTGSSSSSGSSRGSSTGGNSDGTGLVHAGLAQAAARKKETSDTATKPAETTKKDETKKDPTVAIDDATSGNSDVDDSGEGDVLNPTPNPTPQQIFYTGFDTAADETKWQITNMDSATYDNPDVESVGWRLDGRPSSVLGNNPYTSSPRSLNYNNESNYDNSTANAGTAKSPLIDLGDYKNVVLRFRCLYHTDGSTDKRLLKISNDDFSTETFVGIVGEYGGDPTGPCASMGLWHTHEIPLDAAWGRIRIKFVFNTADAIDNQNAGWFIDDVEVIGTLNR